MLNQSNSNSSIQNTNRQILKEAPSRRQGNYAGRQSQNAVRNTKIKQNKISPRKNRERIIELENIPDSAHYYKKQGNQCYNKGQYSSALEHYNKAIELNDTESVFYSNRAKCYRKLGDLNKAYEDAKVAVELDDKNTKAYLLCGQLLAEKGKNESEIDMLNKAENKIAKALSLCISQDEKEFERDIRNDLLKVKKLIWYKQEAKRKQKKTATLDFIKELINKDSSLEDENLKEQKYQEVLKVAGDPSKKLVKDIPDYLCCKITMEMFEHPTVAPSGISYEREALEKHLRSGKEFDPTTREKMSLEFIHPNKSLEYALDEFLEKHPWAYELDEDENEDNCDIKF